MDENKDIGVLVAVLSSLVVADSMAESISSITSFFSVSIFLSFSFPFSFSFSFSSDIDVKLSSPKYVCGEGEDEEGEEEIDSVVNVPREAISSNIVAVVRLIFWKTVVIKPSDSPTPSNCELSLVTLAMFSSQSVG